MEIPGNDAGDGAAGHRGIPGQYKNTIPDTDMAAMSEIMEGGLSGYAYIGKQTGRDGLQQVSGC